MNYSTGGGDVMNSSAVPTPVKEDFLGPAATAGSKNPVSLFSSSTPMGLRPPPAASNSGDGGGGTMSTAQWEWLTEAILKIDKDCSTMASEMAKLRVSVNSYIITTKSLICIGCHSFCIVD
jgi:hypothetical protein